MAKPQYTLVLSLATTGGVGVNNAGPAAATQLWLTRSAYAPGVTSVAQSATMNIQNRIDLAAGVNTGSPEKLNSRSGDAPYAIFEQGSDRTAGGTVVQFAGVGGYRKFTWTPSRPNRPIGGDVPAANVGTGFQQVDDNSVDTKVYSWQWQAEPGNDAWHGRRRPRTRDCLWNVHRSKGGKLNTACYTENLVVIGRVDFP